MGDIGTHLDIIEPIPIHIGRHTRPTRIPCHTQFWMFGMQMFGQLLHLTRGGVTTHEADATHPYLVRLQQSIQRRYI